MSTEPTPDAETHVAEAEQTPVANPMAPRRKIRGFDDAAETQFQNFMSPMFADLEERVKEQEAILDKINEQMRAEREAKRKAQLQEHIPQPLKGGGKTVKDVFRKVERLIMYDIDEEKEKEADKPKETPENLFQALLPTPEGEEEEKPAEEEVEEEVGTPVPVRKLDEPSHAAVTAHSLAAYVSSLPEDHLKKFTSKITADCHLWLSKMFRFEDSSSFFHDIPGEGLVRVCRLALYQKYPKYVTEGFEALYSRPPVIYLSAASRTGLSHYLCLQLGLPMSSICTVPCNTLFGSSSKMYPNKHERMDTELLSKLIEDDIAAAKTPVALVAYAGTPSVGHVDEIEKIQEICKKHKIWLHVEGHNLATLGMLKPPDDVSEAKYGDSITLDMGTWLGIPAIPLATLFKPADPSLVHAASLNTFNPQVKLTCLPIWVVLQSLGIEGIESRIMESCDLAVKMFDVIDEVKNVKQISRVVKKDQNKTIKSISDLFSRALDALLMFDMVTPTVVFKYTEDQSNTSTVVAPYAVGTGLDEEEDSSEEDKKKKSEYFNALNTWLSDTLQSDVPKVEISTVEVEREGVCIRFSPLESAQVLGTTEDDIEAFKKCLKEQIEILDATVLNYEKFRIVASGCPNLRTVEVSNWAGLGAVQYIPNEYLETLDNLSALAVREITNLNIELVHHLKSTDTAFSLGYTDMEMACVKFGLITEETDVEELVGIVQEAGKQVEESSKYMESMSEMIRKGIEEANKDLELENQNKIAQEGVLRQIPMLNAVVNWWSPPPKTLAKGRTFNLASGTIASTEETYKYKMQIQSDAESPKVSPRSQRTTSESGSVSSLPSPAPSVTSPVVAPAPGVAQKEEEDKTETAGEVKARLLNLANDADLMDRQDSLPSPNGNLSLNLEGQDPEVKPES